jgi:hypothetical protein
MILSFYRRTRLYLRTLQAPVRCERPKRAKYDITVISSILDTPELRDASQSRSSTL